MAFVSTASTEPSGGRVVHVNDKVPGAVYIGRAMPRQGLAASPWANPYKIGHMGWDRETVIELYEADLEEQAMNQPKPWLKPRVVGRLPDLPMLRGKPLACWCRHDGETEPACHGDILLEFLDKYTDDELRAMGGSR